jgi:PKD repeat protein/flagellar hook assembly protein FlgD
LTPEARTDTAITHYSWDLDGDGQFETSDAVGYNKTYTYHSPGEYVVRLRASDSAGSSYQDETRIVVYNEAPALWVTVQPRNGTVPLSVTVRAEAIDTDPLARYEWDLDGDGEYELSRASSAASDTASFTYTTPGVYPIRARVTDRHGASTTATGAHTRVQAYPEQHPVLDLKLNPAVGQAPLQVSLSASVTLPPGSQVHSWAWDVDGDGQTDATDAGRITRVYSRGGQYYPSVSVTLDDGRSLRDTAELRATSTRRLRVVDSTLHSELGRTSAITTLLVGDERVSLVIEDPHGHTVRRLLPWQMRASGQYSDPWDGRDDHGQLLPSGPYYAVLLYGEPGHERRLDLRNDVTINRSYNPPRTTLPPHFAPFAQQPLRIDFTLQRPAEVTSFMGLINTDVRLRTFHQRSPLGAGTHSVFWNADTEDGRLIPGNPNNPFQFGIFAFDLPDNVIYVQNAPVVSALKALPAIVSPLARTERMDGASRIGFDLSKPADVELVISDAGSGREVYHRLYRGVVAGPVSLRWDAVNDDGEPVAPGRYRIGVRAFDALGNRSPFMFTLQRVYY